MADATLKDVLVEIRITNSDESPTFVWKGMADKLYLRLNDFDEPRVIDLRVWAKEKK